MVRSLWSAASGMIAQQTNLDTISNNLANVNTTGYKTDVAEFKSLLYQTMQTKTTTAVDGRPIYQHPRRQNESTLCQLSEISLEPEQTEQTDAVWEDFDLRKAVVYSEILRPKF